VVKAVHRKKNKTRKNMKKRLSTFGILSLVAGAYLTLSTVSSFTPVAVASGGKKAYNGSLYVGGMGGHFSVVDVTIDPNNKKAPITVNSLDKLDIGGKGHPTLDARIDAKDKNTMYWSTYRLDTWKEKGKGGGNLHVGKSNLATGEVITDIAFPAPDRAKWTNANYFASGQSANSYIPVSAANEGYIDVYDKKTMKLKHRVFLGGLGIRAGETTLAHGINTPDMKKFLLTVLQEATIIGVPKHASGGTITFRQSFTADGKYLLQSGFDSGYLIDAETLEVLDTITPLPGMNYDIIPTPDGKYAVMALREKTKDPGGNNSIDGTILLYDIENRITVGKTESVCFACHKGEVTGKAILGGLDANWK
jgi:hypothetical protein